ncbi:hypothetical protein D3C71_808060 [compost metagenome]
MVPGDSLLQVLQPQLQDLLLLMREILTETEILTLWYLVQVESEDYTTPVVH